MKSPKKLARTTIYESDWINLHTDKVEMPDGKVIEKMHVLDYPREGVGVVVIDEQDRILFEYSYRYHTGKDGWEIPTGGIDKGEAIIEAARREVLEETGFDTKDHTLMYSYNPSNGSSNQVLHVVFCKLASNKQGDFDKNEVREVKWFRQDEVKQMIQDKDIIDGFSLIGLLLYLGGYG